MTFPAITLTIKGIEDWSQHIWRISFEHGGMLYLRKDQVEGQPQIGERFHLLPEEAEAMAARPIGLAAAVAAVEKVGRQE